MNKFKFVGVIDENPYDLSTWSGSSVYFFNALKDEGVLHEAISAQPKNFTSFVYKMMNFQASLSKWKFKYHLDTRYYNQMTRSAKYSLDHIDSNKYDVLIQVGAWYDLSGYRSKPVVSYHDGNLATLLASPYKYPSINRKYIQKTLEYERSLYNKINIIFPMSRWLADSFVRDFDIPASKVFPIGAGINLPALANTNEKSYEEPNILFVGKDFARKGGETLLKAFNLVRKEIKNAKLTVVGGQIQNAPEGVRCVGYLSKHSEQDLKLLLKEYQNATIFVLPSLYEPFGIAFLEAMAHKLPCIGTSICAMPEIIKNNITGYIVNPNDSSELSKKIISLLNDSSKCKAFGAAGFSHYSRNYTWSSVVKKMVEVVENNLF